MGLGSLSLLGTISDAGLQTPRANAPAVGAFMPSGGNFEADGDFHP